MILDKPELATTVFFGGSRLAEFGFRFTLNAIVIFLLVRIIYYPRHRNKDFLFSFFLFNIINFIICYLLSSATIKIGFAFGLFAIFSIIRYRSVSVPIREMAYLLTSVTIGILNALSSLDTGLPELLISNGVLLLLTLAILLPKILGRVDSVNSGTNISDSIFYNPFFQTRQFLGFV